MLEAKLKANQLHESFGDGAIDHVKHILEISYKALQLEPSIENSHNFNFWGDVMDELYNLDP